MRTSCSRPSVRTANERYTSSGFRSPRVARCRSSTIPPSPDTPTSRCRQSSVDSPTENTREDQRDGHLKSPDFLNAEKYPYLTFKSKRVEATDDNHGRLIGDLTIRDVTKEVALDVEYACNQPHFINARPTGPAIVFDFQGGKKVSFGLRGIGTGLNASLNLFVIGMNIDGLFLCRVFLLI